MKLQIQEQEAQNAAYIGGAPSTAGVSWAGKRLEQLPGAFSSGDPLANVATFGDMMKDAGEDALIAGAATKVASSIPLGGGAAGSGGATGGAIGAVGGVSSFLVGGIAGAMKALGDLAFPVGLTLITEGAVLEYVFPAIPGVILMIAIIGWLFLVIELVAGAVLWAAAHVFAEGEGFSPPQAQYGYSAALGIIFRPLLLTLGFIFAFFIMDIGGWFIGEALKVYLSGMGDTHIGIIGFVALMAVIIATIFMFIKTVLKLITHLADRLPQWIGGHSGQGLGEAEIAQGAIQNAGGGAQKYGMYAGDKIASIGDGVTSGARSAYDATAGAKSDSKVKERTTAELSGGQSSPQDGENIGSGSSPPPPQP